MTKGLQIESVLQLHSETHGSIQRMTESIQPYYTWFNWKADITKVFNSCKTCQELQISKPEGPPCQDKLKLTDLEPMLVLQIDQFHHGQKNYLSVHDQLSTYSWMCPLHGTDTSHILK